MHSPGPWRIIRSSYYTEDPADTTIQDIEDANGKTVYYTDSGYFRPREDDVRLIVEAPNLLAALKQVAATFTVDRCSAQSLERTLDELRLVAREIIKRVEGS